MSPYDVKYIRHFLAHRYPFLLVDRVLELDPEKSILALKNVTINEPFFTGHFPQEPVMPGVLIVEAIAQAAGIWVGHHIGYELEEDKGLFYLAGIDHARFKRMVVPGDQLILDLQLIKKRGDSMFKCAGQARVGDELACSCEILAVRG